MQRAVYIVRNNPGCTKKFVAEIISPHPNPYMNWALGYNPVNRAIRAGLIRAVRVNSGKYALYSVE